MADLLKEVRRHLVDVVDNVGRHEGDLGEDEAVERRLVLRRMLEEGEHLELRQESLPCGRLEDLEHHRNVLVRDYLDTVQLRRLEQLPDRGDELRQEVDSVQVVLVQTVRSLMRTIQMQQRETSSWTGTSPGGP